MTNESNKSKKKCEIDEAQTRFQMILQKIQNEIERKKNKNNHCVNRIYTKFSSILFIQKELTVFILNHIELYSMMRGLHVVPFNLFEMGKKPATDHQ